MVGGEELRHADTSWTPPDCAGTQGVAYRHGDREGEPPAAHTTTIRGSFYLAARGRGWDAALQLASRPRESSEVSVATATTTADLCKLQQPLRRGTDLQQNLHTFMALCNRENI